MKKMNNTDYSMKVQELLKKNSSISVKITNLECKTLKHMEQIILFTLQYYKMDIWHDYFNLLARGLVYFAIKSCGFDLCRIKLIKESKAFIIQIQSEELNTAINKREFIEFINDLSEIETSKDFFTDFQFLKKLFEIKQIDADNITYSSGKIELYLPESKLSEENWGEIRESIVTSIDQFPPMKENLIILEEMIHSGEYDMNTIAEQVGTDPALTIDILKIVNSGAFVLNAKIDDIHSALKYLGLRELYNVMISLSIRKVLSMFDKKMTDFWYYSNKCAYYACHIADTLNIKVSHTDSIYTSALLHDIGKFPISMIFDDSNEVLLDYCTRYNIFLSNIEDAITGIRHCETGYLMGEKWNLPDSLKLVMKFHHEPSAAPEHIRNLNDIIYLSNCLLGNETGSFDKSALDRAVLQRHNLNSFEELANMFKHLSNQFDSKTPWSDPMTY